MQDIIFNAYRLATIWIKKYFLCYNLMTDLQASSFFIILSEKVKY